MKALHWREFEEEAPPLAADVRDVIEHHRFAFVGTIRRDGTPRISPVEVHLVGDDLMLVVLPRTRKADDVRRDDRVVLQSPIMNAGNPGSEFKLRGHALAIGNGGQREAAAEVIESYSGWRPGPHWLYLAVLLTDVTHTAWRPDGSARLSRWSATGRVPSAVELRLDMDLGGYRASSDERKRPDET